MDNYTGQCFILESTYRRYREEANIYEVRYLVKRLSNPGQRSFFVTGLVSQPELAGSLVNIPAGKMKHHAYGDAYHIFEVDEITSIGNSQSALLKNLVAKILDLHGISYDSNLLWTACREYALVQLDQSVLTSILEEINVGNEGISSLDMSVASSLSMTTLFNSLEKIEPTTIFEREDSSRSYNKGIWPRAFLSAFSEDVLMASHGRCEILGLKNIKRFHIGDEVGYQYIDNFFLALQKFGAKSELKDWFSSGLRSHTITKRFMVDLRKSGSEAVTNHDLQKLHAVDVHNAEKILSKDGYYIEVNTDKGIVYVPQSIHRQTSQLYELALRSSLPVVPQPLNNEDLFNFGLDSDQLKAVKDALDPSLSLVSISGPPGSGKSHLISIIAQLAQRDDCAIPVQDMVFLTPTGTAAARINKDFRANGWKCKARTIHSLFYGKFKSKDSHKLQNLLEGKEINFGQIDIGRVSKYIKSEGIEAGGGEREECFVGIDRYVIERNTLEGKTVIVDEGTQISLDVFSALLNLNPSRIIIFSDLQQTKAYGLGRPVAGLADLWKAKRTGSGVSFVELGNDYRANAPLHDISSCLRKGWLPKVPACGFDEVDFLNHDDSAFRIIEAEKNPVLAIARYVDSVFERAKVIDVVDILKSLQIDSRNFIGVDRFRFADDLILGIKNKIVRRINRLMAGKFIEEGKKNANFVRNSIVPKLAQQDVHPGAIVMQSVNEKAEVSYLSDRKTPVMRTPGASNGERFALLGYRITIPMPRSANSTDDANLIRKLWGRIGINIDDIQLDSKDLLQLINDQAAMDAEAAQVLNESTLIEAVLIRHDLLDSPGMSDEDVHVYPLLKKPEANSLQRQIIAACYAPADIYEGTGEELEEWLGAMEMASLEFSNFKCAFAMNVYKAQGSQSKRVSIILDGVAEGGLKNFSALLYTGVTRAKSEVGVILLEGLSNDLAASYSASHAESQSLSCLDLLISGKLGVAPEMNSVFSVVQAPVAEREMDVMSFAAAEAAVALGLPSHAFGEDPSLAWMTSLTPNVLSAVSSEPPVGFAIIGNAVAKRNKELRQLTPCLTRDSFVAFQNNALLRGDGAFNKPGPEVVSVGSNFKI